MNDVLDKKIEDVLDSADRMFIATSVGEIPLVHQFSMLVMVRIFYFLPLTQQEKQSKFV